MATLLDPFEISGVLPIPTEDSVDVEFDDEDFLEPAAAAPEGPRGVSELAWRRARTWTAED